MTGCDAPSGYRCVMVRKIIGIVSFAAVVASSSMTLASDLNLAKTVVKQLEFQSIYDVMAKELANIRSATIKGLKMSKDRAKGYNQFEQADKFNALLIKAEQSKAFNRQVTEIENRIVSRVVEQYSEKELKKLINLPNKDQEQSWKDLEDNISAVANAEINQSIKDAARESKYYMNAVIAIYDEHDEK